MEDFLTCKSSIFTENVQHIDTIKDDKKYSNVNIYPLAILAITEYYTRINCQAYAISGPGYAVGALLGKREGEDVGVVNAIELDFDYNGEGHVIDLNYFAEMKDKYKEVFPSCDIIGIYCIGKDRLFKDSQTTASLLMEDTELEKGISNKHVGLLGVLSQVCIGLQSARLLSCPIIMSIDIDILDTTANKNDDSQQTLSGGSKLLIKDIFKFKKVDEQNNWTDLNYTSTTCELGKTVSQFIKNEAVVLREKNSPKWEKHESKLRNNTNKTAILSSQGTELNGCQETSSTTFNSIFKLLHDSCSASDSRLSTQLNSELAAMTQLKDKLGAILNFLSENDQCKTKEYIMIIKKLGYICNRLVQEDNDSISNIETSIHELSLKGLVAVSLAQQARITESLEIIVPRFIKKPINNKNFK